MRSHKTKKLFNVIRNLAIHDAILVDSVGIVRLNIGLAIKNPFASKLIFATFSQPIVFSKIFS